MKSPTLGYKAFLVIPLLLLILGIGILANSYVQTGEWFKRDIELKGGTVITVQQDSGSDVSSIEEAISSRFGAASVRELRGLSGYSLVIQVGEDVGADEVLSELQSMGVDTSEYSTETIGSSLGEGFWQQAQMAIALAFIAMGIVVFVIFRSVVPSTAIIFSAVSDIIVTLAIMQLFGIVLSLAALAALLMLIGYSVDTDILLTTRVLRGKRSINSRVISAMKTGLTMTITSMSALAVLLVTVVTPVLTEIAAVLFIGLAIDIVNTWLMNAALIKWYAERRSL